jgi:hypothetical protein
MRHPHHPIRIGGEGGEISVFHLHGLAWQPHQVQPGQRIDFDKFLGDGVEGFVWAHRSPRIHRLVKV